MLEQVIMIRADLILSRIKPVLFRDWTLYTFFWRSFKSPQADAPGWKSRWLSQMKSKGWLRRFLSQKWCCEITSLEIRALSTTTQGEWVIHPADLDGIEKTLGMTDSLLQSCCIQADNLIFQQKINTPADHSQPAFPWFLPHQSFTGWTKSPSDSVSPPVLEHLGVPVLCWGFLSFFFFIS